MFAVPTGAAGVTAERQDTFNHEPQFHVVLDRVAVGADERLSAGTDGAVVLGWILDRAVVGLSAQAAGVAEVGIVTAGYVAERKQFDKALGTFQAVCHRMADCYVDAGAIYLSMLQAATQLDAAGPEDVVDPEACPFAVAKYWASYSGSRVGHADLHLHGGISIDLDYPIHRYFLWSKQLELQLGAGTPAARPPGRRARRRARGRHLIRVRRRPGTAPPERGDHAVVGSPRPRSVQCPRTDDGWEVLP